MKVPVKILPVFTLVIISVGYVKANLCKKTPKPGKFACCPNRFLKECCPSISPCDGSRIVSRPFTELYGPLLYKALCSDPVNTTACLAGFYLDAHAQSKPCPPGFFCPKDETCITPCPLGSYCVPFTLIHIKKRNYKSMCGRLGRCCKDSSGQLVPPLLDITKKYVCPGPITAKPCPKGHFCKKSTEKARCPKGFYCREGTTYPERCPGNKLILQGVSGEIRSKEVTAIMGPSGAGKTSLLNLLSNKASYGYIEGELRANGQLVDTLGRYRNVIGFVPQEDIMHRTLTVEEVLNYQACIRLPARFSRDEVNRRVKQILKLLEISHIRKSYIGDEEQRGISGGQRKRVNIGMELVADPTLLFLDEPTSGLDSSSSLTILNALRKVAQNGGLTVACVIHQPRYEIFKLFHNVFLLGPGGKAVYQGPVTWAEMYFGSLGFHVPLQANPADYFLDVITCATYGDFTHDPEKLPEYWRRYRESAVYRNAVKKKVNLPKYQSIGIQVCRWDRLPPGVFSQFFTFLKREFTLQFRQMKTTLLDVFLALLASGVLGGLFKEVQLNQFLPMATMSAMGIGLISSVPALRVFGQYRTVYWREAGAGVNRFSYFLAGNISQLPQMFAMPLIYLSLQYTFTAPRGRFSDYYILCSLGWFAVSGCAYLISCIFNPRNAQMAAVLFVLISSLLSGTTPSICTMKEFKALGPVSYSLSYARWYVEALFESEVKHFDAVHTRIINALAYKRNYTLNRFWICLSVLVAFGLGTRCLAFICLVSLNKDKQK